MIVSLIGKFILFVYLCSHVVKAQCYINSDISIYQFGYPHPSQYQESNNQCLANHTVISASIIDGFASKGITCSKKESTATNGKWTLDGDNDFVCNNDSEPVGCTSQPGSVTLYTTGEYSMNGDDEAVKKGTYTCCIEGLCTSIRLFRFGDLVVDFPFHKRELSKLESCAIGPPPDMTSIPQHYMVQMVTSVFPLSRLASLIECNKSCGDGVTLGKSYYTLSDLAAERYQFTVPVTWSADSSTNTKHTYNCKVRFGGIDEEGDGIFIKDKQKSVTVSASSAAPSSVTYDEVSATAVKISWMMTGNDVNGFVINITSSGLETITKQLTDSSLRASEVGGLLPEVNYTVEIRGYYELLGPVERITVRLKAGINSVNSSLLSVSNDLSTQIIQVNCYTFRVEPNQITLLKVDNSEMVDSGSELLDNIDKTYRHYITLSGSFSAKTNVSCSINVNGVSSSESYQLQASSPPNIVSVEIMSTTSLLIRWVSVPGVNGYIIHYKEGQPLLIEGEGWTNHTLNGLITGNQYIVQVYSYTSILSETSSTVVNVLFDVPLIASFEAKPHNLTSVLIFWDVLNSVVDNYTVTVSHFCLNMDLPPISGINGTYTSLLIPSLSSGFQYSISITPINILGKGTERTGTAILHGSGHVMGAPLLLSPVIFNSTVIRLAWEKVNCSDIITGYNVQYNSNGGIQSTVNVTANDTRTEITGLTHFTLYSVSVAAIIANRVGPYSNEYKVYTVSTQVFNLMSAASTFFVLLSWQLPLTNVTYEFEVAYRIDSECNNHSTLHNGYTVYSPRTSSNSIEVFGLMSSTCYVFGVRAYPSLSNNSSGNFNVVDGVTISETIANIVSSDHQSTSITLSWLPLITQTDDVYIYEVSYSPRSNDTHCTDNNIDTLPDGYTLFGNTSDTSIVVTGLEPGTCYAFGLRIFSLKSKESGKWTTYLYRTQTSVSSSNNVGAIAGGTTVALIAIIIVIVLLLTFLAIRKLNKNVDQSSFVQKLELPDYDPKLYANKSTAAKTATDGENRYDNTVLVSEPEYVTITDVFSDHPIIPEIQPISLDNFGRYILECHGNGNEEFKIQFESLYEGYDKSCNIGQSGENKVLNRFRNITAYDENHITLFSTIDYTPDHSFINAGFVDGYSVLKKYIATQGPLPRTVGDFWHMVWQEKVQFIVMLTNFMENGKKKCAHYWPERVNESKMFGSFTITLLEENSSYHIILRKLQLHSTCETRFITHYQYISWPDYGVPDSVSPLLSLTSQVMDSWSQDKGPVVVHCSAGVGRTGTFIAIDIGAEQIKREGKVDIAGIVTKICQQRIKMVQTSAQYAFVYDAVLESSVKGVNEAHADDFKSNFKIWKKSKTETGKTVLEMQFEVLNYVTPQHDQVIRKIAQQFPEKNRNTMYLPIDKWRVPLKHAYPDYIHATFVHGYSIQKAFIIAQNPMDTTIEDFWKMILDYKVSVIVMCSDEFENKEQINLYWDSKTAQLLGKLKVNVESESCAGNVVKRLIAIYDAKSNSSFEVNQFQIKNWTTDGMRRNALTILKVIEDVVKLRRTTGGGPVVVHCSDTVGCSGVFCAASNALEQCQIEGHVSIFQATKAIRINKPGAVNSLNHYETVFEVLLKYLEQNSTYSNFF